MVMLSCLHGWFVLLAIELISCNNAISFSKAHNRQKRASVCFFIVRCQHLLIKYGILHFENILGAFLGTRENLKMSFQSQVFF